MYILNRKLKAHPLPGEARSIVIDRAIRSTGLLAYLSPEELQTLIALFTFADRSGVCSLSARVIGQELNLSENQARKRLNGLCGVRWHGKPLVVRESHRTDGRFIFVYRMMGVDGIRIKGDSSIDRKRSHAGSSDDGLRVARIVPAKDRMTKVSSDNGSRAGNGEKAITVQEDEVVRLSPFSSCGTPAIMAVSTHSQGQTPVPAKAGRPQTPGCVNNINKHTTTMSKQSVLNKNAFSMLVNAGVSESVASVLAKCCPAERITRQLKMLPFRNAREPAAVLVKAIREDWSAPSAYIAAMREKAAMLEKKRAESQDKLRQETQRQRIEEAISRLSPAELRDIESRAREMVRSALRGALGDAIPQSLLDAQVRKIISDQALEKLDQKNHQALGKLEQNLEDRR